MQQGQARGDMDGSLWEEVVGCCWKGVRTWVRTTAHGWWCWMLAVHFIPEDDFSEKLNRSLCDGKCRQQLGSIHEIIENGRRHEKHGARHVAWAVEVRRPT